MRPFFIDVDNRKVEDVQIENDVEAFCKKIECYKIQCIRLGKTHVAIIDKEGRLGNWDVGFRLPDSVVIAGNALIVCGNEDGSFIDVRVPINYFQQSIKFIDFPQRPMPCPFFGKKALPEDIEKVEDRIQKNPPAIRNIRQTRSSALDKKTYKAYVLVDHEKYYFHITYYDGPYGMYYMAFMNNFDFSWKHEFRSKKCLLRWLKRLKPGLDSRIDYFCKTHHLTNLNIHIVECMEKEVNEVLINH